MMFPHHADLLLSSYTDTSHCLHGLFYLSDPKEIS